MHEQNDHQATPAFDVEAWVAAARRKTQERMAETQRRFGLGSYARYAIDLPTATIRFFDATDRERLCAGIQVAGSWAAGSQSWLWPWENDSLPAAVQARMSRVRTFGAEHELPLLNASVQPCDEGFAWSMAAIAADLLDAQCVYRAPAPSSQLFLLLFDIEERE